MILGTLIGGVPTETLSKIPPTDLLTVSKDTAFINNILTAPPVLQETYVEKVLMHTRPAHYTVNQHSQHTQQGAVDL